MKWGKEMKNHRDSNEKDYYEYGNSLPEAIINVFKIYFKGKLKIAFLLGMIAFLLFWILRIPYGFILSIIIGIFNLIPYIGNIIGGSIVLIFALLSGGVQKALWSLAIIILLEIIEDFFLEPKILGKSFGLHPLLIFIVVLLGGMIFGIPGMILAVPIAGIIRVLFKKYY